MADTTSQVAYYREHAHTAGTEELVERREYWERRTSLYKDLGFPPAFFRRARILDVGCGSGYTSAHLAQFGPEWMTLVEPVEACHEPIRATFRHLAPEAAYEIVGAFGQALELEEPYDIAIAEGFLPWLRDAEDTARSIGRWIRPGGGFCLTTQDPVGYLPDLVKRFCGQWLARNCDEFDKRKEIVLPFYRSLMDVPGMSRSVEDWVLDNVLQPLYNWELFSTEMAIAALSADFVFYSCSSPRYSTEARWYKNQAGPDNDFNARAISQYRRNIHNMLDYRRTLPEADEEANLDLLSLCRNAVLAMGRFERERNESDARAVADNLELLRETCVLRHLGEGTSRSVEQTCDVLQRLLAGKPPASTSDLAAWSGRGQHYVSFLKRDGLFLR